MATLSAAQIAALLAPYYPDLGADVCEQLSAYLDLLLRWNAKTNLTAIREPEEIVRRHFGESLFAGLHLPPCRTLLDFGSGAGFPGIPIQLIWPEITVTLAESQSKKVSFLREAIRVLGLNTEVFPGRVESMPEGVRFDAVTLRAVDQMEQAMVEAQRRTSKHLLLLTTSKPVLAGFEVAEFSVPGMASGWLVVATRL